MIKAIVYLTGVIVYFVSVIVAAQNNTPDYWQCFNRVGGSWTFGRAPYVCDVDAFGDPVWIEQELSALIFDDNIDQMTEQNRYVSSLYTTLRDAAEYYLQQRKSASNEEVRAWLHAIYALSHQESFMSHYRESTDSRIKMMRGDVGHGHGLMQIDDRWHFVAINEGKGWQVFENMIYAMELFYSYWQSAANASCVSSPIDWEQRARSAYSAYNGGASKICRWTNPNDRWARNDKGYFDKFTSESWNTYVDDPQAPAPVDAVCFIEEGSNCYGGGTDITNTLLTLDSGLTCLASGNYFECVSDRRDAVCLTGLTGVVTQEKSLDIRASDYPNYSIRTHDRHDCAQMIASLFEVGEVIQLQKNINLRQTPGGTLLTTTQSGAHYQIVDFEVQDEKSFKRYYKVRYNNQEGYIYAGDSSSHSTWVIAGDENQAEILVPLVGHWIEIEKSAINLREGPGTEYAILTTVPNASQYEVQALEVLTDTNKVYYQLNYQNYQGYIYGGRLLPGSDLISWASLVDAPPIQNDLLQSRAPVTGLTASRGDFLMFRLETSSSDSKLSIAINGGSGDADLYIRFGQEPTTREWDHRPYLAGNNEVVNINRVQAGIYYVMVRAYSTFDSVTLTATRITQ